MRKPSYVTEQPYVSRKVGWGGVARCVYCGRRCSPGLLACYLHADLPRLDPRYALGSPVMDAAGIGEAAQAAREREVC